MIRPHEHLMRRALELAALGLGRTSPNPAVGAVVAHGNAIVGEGYHRRAGEPHAERVALANAGEAARCADIYVSLEPCCHHGRTPPCTEAIIEAGISRVFYSVSDPDPRCAGGGEAALQAAGLEVRGGVLEEDGCRLLGGYIRHRRSGLPLVTCKLAMSLDGRIATRTGDSRWITSEASRRIVHELRNHSDAVIVGVGTVLADDPALTTRGVPGGRDALRVIMDSSGRTPPDAQVIREESNARCMIVCTDAAPPENLRALEAAGAEVLVLPETDDRVDLRALTQELGRRGALNVLIEGGGELAAGALEAGVVDRVLLFYAPIIIGGTEAVPGVAGTGAATVAQALRLRDVTVRSVGPDMLAEGYLTPKAELRCSRD